MVALSNITAEQLVEKLWLSTSATKVARFAAVLGLGREDEELPPELVGLGGGTW